MVVPGGRAAASEQDHLGATLIRATRVAVAEAVAEAAREGTPEMMMTTMMVGGITVGEANEIAPQTSWRG